MEKKYETCSDEELTRLFREGDNEVASYLLEKYKPLVRKKARALFLAGGDHEDLLQEGMLGLFQAVREYRPDREASFATFAGLCISRQMASAVLASQRKKHRALNESISLDALQEQHAEFAAETAESPESILLGQEETESMLDRLQKKLSKLERSVLSLYLSGLDYRQIAERLEKPPKSIDNALQRIRTKAETVAQ